MGYRIRLGRISKEDATHLRNQEHDVLVRHYEDRNDAMYRPDQHQELYELGKHIDFNAICTESEPFYTKFNVYEEEEGEFTIITQNDLKAIINQYSEWNREYFTNLLNEFEGSIETIDTGIGIRDKKVIGKLTSHLRSKHHAWEPKWGLCPVKYEPSDDGEMTGSWLIEYAIFNLVHILKTFDWENDYLIYSSW